MFKQIIYLCIVSFACHSFADSLPCGETNAVLTNAQSTNKQFFNLTLKNSVINQSYAFSKQREQLNIRCEKNATGDFVYLINHFCGGSGCADWGSFSIIEAKTGAILLKPDTPFKSNMRKVKQIIGKEIKPFHCVKDSNEICLRSDMELG